MQDFDRFAVAPAVYLLPGEGVDMEKWAVIACDQHTSEPDYWRNVEAVREGAPSALDLIYPEAWLSRGDERIASINAHMRSYRDTVLTRRAEGFLLVRRETTDGVRLGLLAVVDLEKYDFSPDSQSPVRPTEATVAERVPPRVRIRRDAPLESSHVLLLADDPRDELIGPLYAARKALALLYDFDLMLDGGHITGWLVGPEWYPRVSEALLALRGEAIASARRAEGDLSERRPSETRRGPDGLDGADTVLEFAVGDGNHSLAAASACWKEIREGLSPSQRISHPARRAMVEITNLHADSLRFHPIHRALFGLCDGIADDFRAWLAERGMALRPLPQGSREVADIAFLGGSYRIEGATYPLPVGVLQPFLDGWLAAHPLVRVDYIHGDDALAALAADGATTFALPAMDKSALFPSVHKGPLPRKTFSMGEAQDKRYYLETRVIRP